MRVSRPRWLALRRDWRQPSHDSVGCPRLYGCVFRCGQYASVWSTPVSFAACPLVLAGIAADDFRIRMPLLPGAAIPSVAGMAGDPRRTRVGAGPWQSSAAFVACIPLRSASAPLEWHRWQCQSCHMGSTPPHVLFAMHRQSCCSGLRWMTAGSMRPAANRRRVAFPPWDPLSGLLRGRAAIRRWRRLPCGHPGCMWPGRGGGSTWPLRQCRYAVATGRALRHENGYMAEYRMLRPGGIGLGRVPD